MRSLTTLLCVAGLCSQGFAATILYTDHHRRATDGAAGGGGGSTTSQSGVPALTASINSLARTLAATNDSVVPFRGGTIRGLVGLLKINNGVVELGNGIKTATAITQNTGRLSANDSTTVGVSFLSVQPSITILMNNLADKRPQFDKAGFRILDVTSLIRDDLKIQADGAGTLAAALTRNVDTSLQPIATQINTEIQGNFTTAINAFQGRGGKIKIPSKAVPALSNLLNDIANVLGIQAGNKKRQGDGTTDTSTPTAQGSADPFASILAADTPTANTAASNFMLSVSDQQLAQLADDENDLTGIPPAVLAVLRKYGVI